MSTLTLTTVNSVSIPSSNLSSGIRAHPYVHFFETLFEPFIGQKAQDFYRRQVSCIHEKGLANYSWNIFQTIGCTIKQYPLDTSLMILTRCPGVESQPLAMFCAEKLNTLTIVNKLLEAKPSSKLTGRVIQMVKYGALFYLLASLPTAVAYEWNSLAEARKHYGDEGSCAKGSWTPLIKPAVDCLQKEGHLQECQLLTTDQTLNDLYVFTRHPSSSNQFDPVSIIRFGEKTCFYTALDKVSAVTKTCFANLKQLNSRTVEKIEDMSLSKAHESLDPGQSVLHIGMHLKYDPENGCGYFQNSTTYSQLDDQSTTCLLTSLEAGGPVSQLCFNPTHPEAFTLKGVEGLKLTHPTSEPVSIIIEDPKAFGLKINPEASCPDEKGISIWDALSWWWTQKTPCKTTTGTTGRQDL